MSNDLARAFRLTAADVALMQRCGRRNTFNDGDVLYRDNGLSPRSYRLWKSETEYEIVTRRVKRLRAAGLIECVPYLHGGARGGWMGVTDAGRDALASTATNEQPEPSDDRALRPKDTAS